MKVGIMQPYFFPYLGYWQLLNAVDRYVIYDDVNFINRGWINRNRILINGQPQYFNLPLLGASQNKLINEIMVNPDPKLRNKNIRTITCAYRNTPSYQTAFPVIEEILQSDIPNAAQYLTNLIDKICIYLGIETELILSSQLSKDNTLKGQEKILQICTILGATEYYNAIGGQALYQKDVFDRMGIRLRFLKTLPAKYRQSGVVFQENLSIIDLMMFCSKDQLSELLNEYELL